MKAMNNSLKERALALYKPPFNFKRGYFFDADGNMVADKHESEAMEVRGWGRIASESRPEELQDTVGVMIAEALTEYWNTRALLANTAQVKSCHKFEYNPEHTDHCDFCKCHKSDHALAAKKG